ncbi:MAG: hypothetical protein IJI66_13935 [Erysipelotrichaceae bacterium]|nr:hypothetical protein [Erysipelotrichaceae bacterium]
MDEKECRDLILEYASDDVTVIHAIDLSSDLKQVIEVDMGSPFDINIRHYEGSTFKEILVKNYLEPIVENIDIYDYLFCDYPGLVKDALELYLPRFSKDHVLYLKYIDEWYKTHDEGLPVCFDEWKNNEKKNLSAR